MTSRRLLVASLIVACSLLAWAEASPEQPREDVTLRGRTQSLRIYGSRGGTPVIVSSGDGGWIHLGPHVAEVLAARGLFVVGFDVKAYLESFTTAGATLREQDEPGDFKVLAEFASRGSVRKPILIGVSEGAGLSVLAASDARTRNDIAGVIGLGLSDLNELGWRWKDAVIYVTHGTPNEPTFSAAAIVDRLSPLPLALIHSTHDEYVSLEEMRPLFNRAREPKRLWTVDASNHRFSDNLAEFDRCLIEAIGWIDSTNPHGAKP